MAKMAASSKENGIESVMAWRKSKKHRWRKRNGVMAIMAAMAASVKWLNINEMAYNGVSISMAS